MLREDNGGGDILLDGVDEVEPSRHEKLLPPRDHTHFPLHCLFGGVFWFHHSLALRDPLH